MDRVRVRLGEATKIIRGWSSSAVSQAGGAGGSSLEEGRLQEVLIATGQCLKRGEGLYKWAHSDRTKGNVFKLKEGGFTLDV